MAPAVDSSLSLRRRLIGQIGLMIVGLLCLAMAAFWGINGLRHDYGGALAGYQKLRTAYEIGFDIATARNSMGAQTPDLSRALPAIQLAITRLETSEDLSPAQREQLHKSLLEAETNIRASRPDAAPLDASLAAIANLSSEIRQSITASQQAADRKRRFTLTVVLSLCGAVVIGGIIVGMRQYRGVMRPIAKLSGAVRAFAGGELSRRIQTDQREDREFAALAHDFNHMAAELDGLYKQLDEKVAVKSRQLVRSERLASVGFLAAGVAHEINNPLSIIAGYGERAIQQLDDARGNSETRNELARKALKVICEEAFRCKQITERLLSLARPGEESRTIVNLPRLVEEVIANVGALGQYKDREIDMQVLSSRDELRVRASSGEIKQVLLNLLVNALEATTPGEGRIEMTITRAGNDAELTVRDNGRGMSPQTLEQVFEPFFSEKRGADWRGTGLGLSITHAIVASHGGTIYARSEGLQKGSEFVVKLPLAQR
jgi:signal transduction histidine kinase